MVSAGGGTESVRDVQDAGHGPWWRRQLSGELWRNRDFLHLWAAQSVSLLGTQITSLALPLVAVLTLEATPGEMGALRTAQAIPTLLFGFVAGALIDRLRRRPVMIWTDLGRAAALATIPLAYAVGSLEFWWLYLVGFVVGTLSLFFDVAYFSFLPSVVEKEQLVDGNSKLEISQSGASLLGPSVGGALVQLMTAPVAIVLDALSFLFSAVLLRRIDAVEAPARPDESHERLVSSIREGLAFLWAEPTLRPLAIGSAFFNFGIGIYGTIGILYFSRDLGLRPAMIGIVVAGFGPGFLLGALLAGRAGARFGVGPAIVYATISSSLWLLLTPLVEGSPRVVTLVLASANVLIGIGGEVWAINNLSLRQNVTPAHLLGRTNATVRMIAFSTAPLAALVAGVLGETVGLRPALFVGACFPFLSALTLARSPVRRVRAISHA